MSLNSIKLNDLFKGFNDDFKVNPSHISNSGIEVFDVSNPIDGYSTVDVVLGKPVRVVKYVAFVRESSFWLAPRTGGSHFSIDRLGVLVVFERDDGVQVGILPSSGTSNLCTTSLKSTDNGSIVLHNENDSKATQNDGGRVFISYGLEFELVVQALFEVSKKVVFGESDDVIDVSNLKLDDAPVSTTLPWKPQWFDGLMYCTWNGLGSVLSHELIIDALTELDASGIKINGIIIDDGWQHSNEYRQLYDLRADEFRFPKGLKGLVKEIHHKFPYIKDIGVWSTLVGYWEGVVQGSELDSLYKTVDVKMRNGKIFRLVNDEEVEKFYDDYFKSLAEAGITCVKIDYQAILDDINRHKVRGNLFRAYHDSLFNSSLKYFNGKVIYCMAMVPNIMLYSLQKDHYVVDGKSIARPTPVFRNSNDFFPTILSSHFWHIYCNLYNTVYTGNLYSIPDFDMFQSKLQGGGEEPLATRVTSLHAAARCISGGPIYFTDSPKKHNVELIKEFSAPSKNNQRVVLRPSGIARPVFPYQSFQAKEIHWGYNYARLAEKTKGHEASVVSIILGAFNIAYDELKANLDWNVIGGIRLDGVSDNLVLRSYKSGTIWLPNDKSASVSLLSGEWDVITASPLIPIPFKPVASSDDDDASIAIFGLLDNICGVSGVDSYQFSKDGDERVKIQIWLKALGVLALYTNFSIHKVLVNIDGKPINESRIRNNNLLEVDIRYEGLFEENEVNEEGLVLVDIFIY